MISCCRGMASHGPSLYGQRRSVDMSCWESVTPSICNRLLTIFSRTRITNLCFRFDIYRRHTYDEETLNAVLEFFSSPAEIDVHAGEPRRVEVLAHGYFLHRFLSSQQHLQRLQLDNELVYIEGEKSIVSLDIVGRNCPNLKYYWSYSQRLRPHVHSAAFLHGCPRFRFGRFLVSLFPDRLDGYASLTSPLELQCGYFYLSGWDELQEGEVKKNEAKVRMRMLGSRLQKMEGIHVIIGTRDSIQVSLELLKAMPPLTFLAFHPLIVQNMIPAAPVFAGVFSLLGQLPGAPLVVHLNGVPEEEFQELVAVKSWDCLPRGVESFEDNLCLAKPILSGGQTRFGQQIHGKSSSTH